MKSRLFFGEYLIQNKIVEEEDLLKALERQKEQTPAFEEMAARLAFLSMKQIFKILTYEAGTDLTFEQAAVKLEFMTEEQVEDVKRSIMLSRPPIGSILASMKIVPTETIKKALIAFKKQGLQHAEIPGYLKKINIFQNIPSAILKSMANIANMEFYESEKILLREGDEIRHFNCIAEGSVEISATKINGESKNHQIKRLNSGEYFGEVSLFGQYKAKAAATCKTETRLIQFDGELLASLLGDHSNTMMDLVFTVTQNILSNTMTGNKNWPI